MVKIIDYSYMFFKKRDIFLSEYPYDISNKFDVVTFYYCKKRIDLPGFKCVEKLTSTINLQQNSEEIWKKFNRKLRQKINKAIKENITWKINENFNEFYAVSNDFVIQKYALPFRRLFGHEIPSVKIMKEQGTLFTAELNGELIAGHLYLEDNENILAWISTSKRLTVNYETTKLINHANCLLHWQAIKYAKEKSIKTFNWGGISNDPKLSNINAYKLSYGGNIEKTYFYSKVNNPLYEKLANIYNYLAL